MRCVALSAALFACEGERRAVSEVGLTEDTVTGAQIPDTMVTDSIGPLGGTVELPDMASVRFPAGALPYRRVVTVAATAESGVFADFETTAPVVSGARGETAIRILIDGTSPSVALEVVVGIPVEVRAAWSDTRQPALFAQVWQDGGSEVLDGFVRVRRSTADRGAGRITALLEPDVFSDRRREDGGYEALLVVAIAPTGRP